MESELLQQLRDIHPPPALPWWPPAPGWWILAAAALSLVIWQSIRLWRRWRRFRPSRRALSLYQNLKRQLEAESISHQAWLHEINKLLKRLAVHGLGHVEVVPAWGDDWLRYLDQRYGQPAFSQGPGRCLGAARFQPNTEMDVQALDALITRFLNRERQRFWRLRSKERNRRD